MSQYSGRSAFQKNAFQFSAFQITGGGPALNDGRDYGAGSWRREGSMSDTELAHFGHRVAKDKKKKFELEQERQRHQSRWTAKIRANMAAKNWQPAARSVESTAPVVSRSLRRKLLQRQYGA